MKRIYARSSSFPLMCVTSSVLARLLFFIIKMTPKCETCNQKETVRHYIYDCKKFDTERNLLEKETEDILKEFGLGHIVDINFQVLTGNLVDVPKQANQRMRIALGKFITSTGRFKADRQYFFFFFFLITQN